MIDLTPLEVRKKKGDFRKALRGYDAQSVDDFLDLVADRLEQLVRENGLLHERTTATESRVAEYRERERALTEALVTAQEMREEMRRQMEREVELKRRESEADAEEVRAAASQMREREEENVRRLRARQNQFVQSYRSFLERELAELAVIVETLDTMSMNEPEDAAAPVPKKRARRAEPGVAAVASVAALASPIRAPGPEPATVAVVPEPDFETDHYESPLPFERAEPEREPDEQLIDLTKHFQPPAPQEAQLDLADAPVADVGSVAAMDEDLPEIELLDEVMDEESADGTDREDPDGWVSTLLEGKGD